MSSNLILTQDKSKIENLLITLCNDLSCTLPKTQFKYLSLQIYLYFLRKTKVKYVILKFENINLAPNYRKPSSWLQTIKTILIWHGLRTHALEQTGWNETRQTKRAVLHEKPIPWWTYASIQLVDQIVSTNSRILEIGGGNSSLYWMGRGNQLVTLETNPRWIYLLKNDERFNVEKHKIIHIFNEDLSSISNELENQLFDVVINDGSGDRSNISEYLATKVNENGILIWDNSEREPDSKAIEQLKLNGWNTLEFYGLGPINAYAWQTTILYRTNIGQLKVEW